MSILRINTCQRCKHVVRVMQPEQGFECRRFPPQVSIMALPAGPGRASLQVHSASPRVPPEHFCGEWAPGLARTDAAEIIDLTMPPMSVSA